MFIGMIGEVVDVDILDVDVDSDGWVCIYGECWCVCCDGGIVCGDQVCVIVWYGLILMVEFVVFVVVFL